MELEQQTGGYPPIFCPFKAPLKRVQTIGESAVETLRFEQRPGMTLVNATIPAFKHKELLTFPIQNHLMILFLEKGHFEFVEPKGQTHLLNNGDWFLAKPAGASFKFRAFKECSLHWIEFDSLASQSLMGFSSQIHAKLQDSDIPYCAVGQSDTRLRNLGNDLSNLDGKDSRERMIAEAKTLEWLALLLDHPVFSPCKIVVPATLNRDELALNAAKQILENRLSEPHSLSALSREVHLNEFKLKKGFRERFNNTVFGYLRQKRMERARELLDNGASSIIEVANAVGYSNASHFARAFKEAFGSNPSRLIRSAS
ncbi:AraC family transcriptional regulator [Puniceicoccaceae bacterium K14]|nr:AraC family transcriptional regulator [Puniceicoccaceae bacterium K14]